VSTVGGATILVVEDESLVRLSVRYYLERAGYVVLEAECAGGALQVLVERRVDLLLTDLELRNGHGFDLVRRARDRNPALAWLVMSAYPTGSFTAGFEPERVLQKPFAEAELLARVREFLTKRHLCSVDGTAAACLRPEAGDRLGHGSRRSARPRPGLPRRTLF
jgi:DNA-binding response OmpR family regulator